MRPRFKALELVRPLAAVLVLLQHVTAVSSERLGIVFAGGMWSFGFAGVDLFFVLSGALMLHAYQEDLGNPARLGAYLGRRAARVMPLLWLLTTAKILLLLAVPALSRADRVSLDVVVASYLMLPLPWPSVYPIIGVAWTLAHEVAFYAIVALGILLGKRAFWICLTVWTAAVIWANFAAPAGTLQNAPSWVRFVLYERNAEFLIGALVYRLSATLAAAHKTGGLALPISVLGFGIVWFSISAYLEFLQGHDDASLIVRYAIPSALVVFSALIIPDNFLSRPFAARVFALPLLIGAASYSLFLSHFLALDATMFLFGALGLQSLGIPPTLLPSAMVTVACVGALFLHKLVELPLMRWSRNRLPT